MSKNYDVIIAGCGAAGLYAAINLPKELNILLLCKRELPLCNSSLAQGGIAGVYNSPTDNIQYHQNDTLIAGSFKNNVEAVHTLVSEAAQDIEHIIKLGVEFDKNADGYFAARSHPRAFEPWVEGSHFIDVLDIDYLRAIGIPVHAASNGQSIPFISTLLYAETYNKLSKTNLKAMKKNEVVSCTNNYFEVYTVYGDKTDKYLEKYKFSKP